MTITATIKVLHADPLRTAFVSFGPVFIGDDTGTAPSFPDNFKLISGKKGIRQTQYSFLKDHVF
jgi:hypothetical protein